MDLKAKSVSDYLNEVSYGQDNLYVPSKFALDFVNFIKLVNGGEGEENKTPVFHYKLLDLIANKDSRLAIMNFRGSSKALPMDTLLVSPEGPVYMEDVQIGTRLFDMEGNECSVTHISKTHRNACFKIELENGETFIANEDHLHVVKRRTQGTDKQNYWRTEVKSTRELYEGKLRYGRKPTIKNPYGDLKWYIPLVEKAVEFDSREVPIDPYTVGVLLGDGSLTNRTICTSELDYEEITKRIPYDLGNPKRDKRSSGMAIPILGIYDLLDKVLKRRISKNKEIPLDYLYNSKEVRIELLRGLMDTDGSIDKGGDCSFVTTSPYLAEGFLFLVKSLGAMARISRIENDYSGFWRIGFCLKTICPFHLPRKKERWIPNKKCKAGDKVGIAAIHEVKAVPTRCIQVDSPTKTYLIENCIPTHNTTLFGEYLLLYIAVFGGNLPGFGNIEVAIYVSDSIENGVKNMRKNLEYRRENSEFLMKYLPEVKFTDIRWEFSNVNKQKFIVKAFGASTGVRGVKELGKRPRLAILDDLVSDDDARSPSIISSIEDTVQKAVTYALHPQRNKIIWLGTPFNASDPLYKAVESGAWTVSVYPVCERFPCTREEFRGAWEDRFNYDYVNDQYQRSLKEGRVASFNQEMMLRIMSEDDRLILDSDIQWYSRDLVMANRGSFNFYITTDFATTEKTSGDFSVVFVWALNNNGDWFWVDGVCARQTMDKNIDALFQMASKYNPMSVGIEVSGQQGGFIPWIREQMMVRNIYFNLASKENSNNPGIKPLTNKMQRFNLVVPWFKAGKMYFPKEMRSHPAMEEIIQELSLASVGGFKSKHDDAIDGISMLAALTVWRPGEATPIIKKDDVYVWDDEDVGDSKSLGSYIV